MEYYISTFFAETNFIYSLIRVFSTAVEKDANGREERGFIDTRPNKGRISKQSAVTRGKQIIDVRPKQGTMQSLGQCRPVMRSVTRCLVARFDGFPIPLCALVYVPLCMNLRVSHRPFLLAINLQRQNGRRGTEKRKARK